jgi:hypothetical protein
LYARNILKFCLGAKSFLTLQRLVLPYSYEVFTKCLAFGVRCPVVNLEHLTPNSDSFIFEVACLLMCLGTPTDICHDATLQPCLNSGKCYVNELGHAQCRCSSDCYIIFFITELEAKMCRGRMSARQAKRDPLLGAMAW